MSNPYSSHNSQFPEHDPSATGRNNPYSGGPSGAAYPGGSAGGPYPYQAYGYGYPAQQPRNKVAPWALGLSIISLVCSLSMLAYVIGIVLGVIGLVVGIVAVVKGSTLPAPLRRRGMSITSIVLSVISLIIGIIFGFFVLSFYGDFADHCGDVPAEHVEDCFDDLLGT